MLTIETWLQGIGLKEPIEECPAWPPDLFALAGTLIRRSGAYLRVFERRELTHYAKKIQARAANWRKRLDGIKSSAVTAAELKGALTTYISNRWSRVIREKDRSISAINESPALAEDLILLTLIADEASVGMGISATGKFLSIADETLSRNGSLSFCWDVPKEILCVLGKQHTPTKGATFRSLSHHLALYQPSEIEGRWLNLVPKKSGVTAARDGLNLLLLPWPSDVETEDFQEVWRGKTRKDGSEPPGYFRYDPKKSPSLRAFGQRLKQALASAQTHAAPIDAIVFPELALTEPQYEMAADIAYESRSILICGLRVPPDPKGRWDSNASVLQAAGAVRGSLPKPGEKEKLLRGLRLYQAKHHRWFLDPTQIVNYQLGRALPATCGAWEHMELERPRVLYFVTVNETTWSVLICEDLARQDPAGDLIRAVGPNLLIALLMDGPQLSNRWPARYAAVLAEDPGTSVLTLTSLGMAERSRPIQGGQRAPVSRVIALWRDAIKGEFQIALDPGHDACVLSLKYEERTEYCADGRTDHGQTRYPVFADYRSFKTGA